MNLTDLKKASEKFRPYVTGFDKDKLAAQADALVKNNPGCPDCAELAASLKGCADGPAVAAILDEVAARK